MQNELLPFAIRFIGFPTSEADILEATLAVAHDRSYRYTRLQEDSLHDPDLYLANADELKALVVLSDLKPSEVRPALLIGMPDLELPYACIERPIRWEHLFNSLDRLIARRIQVLAALEASSTVIVPERRRRERLDLDLTDPADYEKMRGRPPERGSILLIDRTSVFHDYLADALASRPITVDWTDNPHYAVGVCGRQPVSVVMINTSLPDLDAYWLCNQIRRYRQPGDTTVIFLIDNTFEFDRTQARVVGCDGFLTKPLMPQHVLPILGKFLPLSR